MRSLESAFDHQVNESYEAHLFVACCYPLYPLLSKSGSARIANLSAAFQLQVVLCIDVSFGKSGIMRKVFIEDRISDETLITVNGDRIVDLASMFSDDHMSLTYVKMY